MKWISIKKTLPPRCETGLLTTADRADLFNLHTGPKGNAALVWTGLWADDQWMTDCGDNFDSAEPTFWCPLPSTK